MGYAGSGVMAARSGTGLAWYGASPDWRGLLPGSDTMTYTDTIVAVLLITPATIAYALTYWAVRVSE